MGFSALLSAENRQVGQKLLVATACMFTLPVATFFLAAHVFQDKVYPDNWAGGAAILMTNLVVGTYCYFAYIEDEAEKKEMQENDTDNDAQGPRVGIYKQRTD